MHNEIPFIEVLSYDSNEKLKSRIVYYPDGKTIGINETFSNGTLTIGSYFDLDGNSTKKFEMESPPEYPGGIEKFYDFVELTLRNPRDAERADVTGTVNISFTITETGDLEDFKIEPKVFPSLDEEALRVGKLSPKWIPARLYGKAVKVKYTVPIKFK